jgi:hypothetical protein
MRSLLVIILIFFSGRLVSQDAAMDINRVYGLDPLLYNGKIYTYFMPSGTGGNQFLLSADYLTGEVTIKGKTFEGISLNYDIYNQQLLLQYASESGAFNIIEISKAWLEKFRIGNMEFRCISSDKESSFYQVLGDGPYFIMVFWRKDLKYDANFGAQKFTFTPAVKDLFVLTGDQLRPVSNNRSLISLFNPEHKAAINNYLQLNRIKIKKASDKTMTELINYIGNLE